MSVYVGRGVRAWPEGDCPPRKWIATAPVIWATDYPVLLDLAEGLQSVSEHDAGAAICDVVAPTWSRFRGIDLAAETELLDWNDLYVAESDSDESFLTSSVVRLLALTNKRVGVILRDPHLYDAASTRFSRTLIHGAKTLGFDLAIDAPPTVRDHPAFSDLLVDAISVADYCPDLALPPDDHASSIVAACEHSLPLTVLQNLGLNWPREWLAYGPRGELLAWCPPEWSSSIRESMTAQQRQTAYRLIYDHWPPDGWGYLRRIESALRARSPEVLGQYYAYIHSMPAISRDSLYHFLIPFIQFLQDRNSDARLQRHCIVGAARLATRVTIKHGFSRAAELYQQALPLSSDPAVRVRLMFELANLYAVQRQPHALEHSRQLYTDAFKLLQQVTDSEAWLRARIQLLNGLALVEYHEGNSRKALDLENRARATAIAHKHSNPYIAEWGIRLVNMNTAKLLDRRFGHSRCAIEFLTENVERSGLSDFERARLELGRFYFDHEEYDHVINVLGEVFETRGWHSVDESEEMLGRMLFVLALLRTGEHARARRTFPTLKGRCLRRASAELGQLLTMLEALLYGCGQADGVAHNLQKASELALGDV